MERLIRVPFLVVSDARITRLKNVANGDANNFSVARAIQDQLLKDFAARSEFSDWFSRDDEVPKAPVVLQPNPKNIELDEKMAQLEINVKR